MGFFLSLVLLCLVSPATPSGPTTEPSVEDILERALARAEWRRTQSWESKFRFRVLSRSEKLNKQGEIEESQAWLYETLPLDGVSYSRLVQKNGRPLTYREIEAERQREKEFRAKLREGTDPHTEREDRVIFNEDLVGRYDVQLEGVEDDGKRQTYVLSFRPRSGKLPVHKRIDRALNESQGRLWIDTETYEVRKLTFELLESIRIWWGFAGSITAMHGRFERSPVEGHREVWLPTSLEIYLNGRVFFRSLHRRQEFEWHDFSKADTVTQRETTPAGAPEEPELGGRR